MLMRLCFFIIILLGFGHLFGQTYLINNYHNQTLVATSGTIYDDGGPSGKYCTNCTFTMTLDVGQANIAKLTFTSIATEVNYDYIRIYYADNANGSAEMQLSGNQSNIEVTSTSRYMTLLFYSDYSVNFAGFEAVISTIANNKNNYYYFYGLSSNSVMTSVDSFFVEGISNVIDSVFANETNASDINYLYISIYKIEDIQGIVLNNQTSIRPTTMTTLEYYAGDDTSGANNTVTPTESDRKLAFLGAFTSSQSSISKAKTFLVKL